MSNLAPLLTPLSKNQRAKSKKYVAIGRDVDDPSPYGSLGGVKPRKKKKKIKAQIDFHIVDSTLGHQYEEALRRRDFRQVLWMITNGDIPANYETKTGETALLAAVSAKNVDALEVLMKSGFSIDTSNRKGYTPLMKAIAVAVPEHRPLPKETPLSNNNGEELPIQSARVDIGTTGTYENDIVESVLAFEPNLLQTDQSGRTAFDWAKLTGNTQALEWLEQRQRDKSIQFQSLANRQERVAQCQELLSRHEEYVKRIESLIAPQFFDEGELLSFLKATTIPSTEFFSALADLKTVVDAPTAIPFRSEYFVNVETREGWTPLAKCAAFGYVAAVQELLALGADLHYETRLRHTAMTWASYCGHEAVVLHLLLIGVDVNQTTRDGKTALLHAISNSQAKIVHHLLLATRDQSFPAKPIETFASEIDPQLKKKYLKSDQRSTEVQLVETEWHEAFLKKMRWQDQTGKDVLKQAQYAVEQAHLVCTDLQDEPTSDLDEALAPAIQVLRQVQKAIKEAEDHKLKFLEAKAEPRA
ncbi:hypothetical protein PF004_g5952 [Phytophthora fragariae]|uniref:Uncharacterized protein n=1 Tax=Phytophthora fragariae TaxID=53985 RepID=A0A6G0PEB1_9STRA|nr:hypothetical protein PF004_g5952 [Phytophthora fragariae]